jgi:hypothetical protein
MKESQEEITQGKKLRKRFLELVFGGLPYKEMPRTITAPTMYAKELENHLEEMKFHYHHS